MAAEASHAYAEDTLTTTLLALTELRKTCTGKLTLTQTNVQCTHFCQRPGRPAPASCAHLELARSLG